MTLKLEKGFALCPLGKFKIHARNDSCFDDRASEYCLNCFYGNYAEGPNLFKVCKAPDKKTKEELFGLVESYKKTNGKLAPTPFQEFLEKTEPKTE